MRLELSAPHETRIRSTVHRASCYGAFADLTVAFIPLATPGYQFVSEAPADEYRADYVARFPIADYRFFDSPRPQDDPLVMQQDLALQVVLRTLYFHMY